MYLQLPLHRGDDDDDDAHLSLLINTDMAMCIFIKAAHSLFSVHY